MLKARLKPMISYDWLIACLVIRTESGSISATSRASASPASSAAPSATTSLTMPKRNASSAPMRSWPLSSMRLARFGLTYHGSNSATMLLPKRSSGSPNRVLSSHTLMSQASAISKPPAST